MLAPAAVRDDIVSAGWSLVNCPEGTDWIDDLLCDALTSLEILESPNISDKRITPKYKLTVSPGLSRQRRLRLPSS